MDATLPRFPYQDRFMIGETEFNADQIIEYLIPHLNQERRDLIDQVVQERTFSIATVCDNLYDFGNIAAVMRSAEAMGIQPMHVIARQQNVKISKRVTRGTEKWLDVKMWRDPLECVEHLKQQGYRIAVTQLSDDAVMIDELDFTIPTALVLGNEHSGVGEDIVERSDVRCIIPMRGFAESFNISVAAAISFYHIVQDRIRRQGKHGDLSPEELQILRAEFYRRAHTRGDQLLEALFMRRQREEQKQGKSLDAP